MEDVSTQAAAQDSFVNYMAFVEDAELKNKFSSDPDYVSPAKESAEGGRKTAGFGHKMMAGEKALGPLGKDQSYALLREDIDKAYTKAGHFVDSHSGKGAWKNLTLKEQESLTDFEFNVKGGIASFPKLTDAVVSRNQSEIIKQFRRSYTTKGGEKKDLSRRNKAWWGRYGRELSGGIKYQQTSRVASDLKEMDDFGIDTARLSFG
jgi:GH24 family phage-related lysozyme (muramidase)